MQTVGRITPFTLAELISILKSEREIVLIMKPTESVVTTATDAASVKRKHT